MYSLVPTILAVFGIIATLFVIVVYVMWVWERLKMISVKHNRKPVKYVCLFYIMAYDGIFLKNSKNKMIVSLSFSNSGVLFICEF